MTFETGKSYAFAMPFPHGSKTYTIESRTEKTVTLDTGTKCKVSVVDGVEVVSIKNALGKDSIKSLTRHFGNVYADPKLSAVTVEAEESETVTIVKSTDPLAVLWGELA